MSGNEENFFVYRSEVRTCDICVPGGSSSAAAGPLYINYQCTESSILYDFSVDKNFCIYIYTKEIFEVFECDKHWSLSPSESGSTIDGLEVWYSQGDHWSLSCFGSLRRQKLRVRCTPAKVLGCVPPVPVDSGMDIPLIKLTKGCSRTSLNTGDRPPHPYTLRGVVWWLWGGELEVVWELFDTIAWSRPSQGWRGTYGTQPQLSICCRNIVL